MSAATPAQAAHPVVRRRFNLRPILLGSAGVVFLAAMLEIVSRLGLVNEKFLPPFSTVFGAMLALLVDPAFLTHVGSTVVTWAIGLGLSIVVAVPVGVVLGLFEGGYRASRTVIELVRTLPAVALIPLVILAVGSGLEMKVTIALYAAVWPILFNTIYGVHGTDPKAKEMGKSFGLGRLAVVRRIVLPSAAPFIATGIRVSSSIVLIVIVTVEIVVGGATGVGAYISQQRILGDQTINVYAGILVTGLLGLTINLILGAIERRVFRWNQTARS